MSKELDYLDKILNYQPLTLVERTIIECIKEKIQYLESIDNADSSEALECLEKLKGMEISSMPFSDEYGTQEVDLNDIRKVGSQLNTDFREYTTTIQQALLKAQEPKQYLKWEDLKKLGKEIKVKLNGVEYLLCKKIVLGFPEYYLYPEGNQKPVLMCLGDSAYEKQFFNALHLERVE